LKKAKLYWIAVLPLLFLIALYLFYYGMKEARKNAAVKTEQLKPGVYQEITGFCLTEYFYGKKKMEVKTEKATIKSKRIGFFTTPLVKEAHMVKPYICFYTNGKEASRITADSGKMNMNNKRIVLKKNVVLTTADNKRLSTKEMVLNPKNGLVSIMGSFILDRNGDIIKGKGLKSDVELKRLVIKRKTRQDK